MKPSILCAASCIHHTSKHTMRDRADPSTTHGTLTLRGLRGPNASAVQPPLPLHPLTLSLCLLRPPNFNLPSWQEFENLCYNRSRKRSRSCTLKATTNDAGIRIPTHDSHTHHSSRISPLHGHPITSSPCLRLHFTSPIPPLNLCCAKCDILPVW